MTWGDPLEGFADVWLPSTVSVHLGSEMPARRVRACVAEILQVAPQATVEVSVQQVELVRALTARGFRRTDGPWFARMWRSLTDLSDLRAHRVPEGVRIRGVRRDELAQRVEIHRRCWAPAHIKRLLGLPVTGDESGSRYSADKHRAVIGTPPYREELDLVAEAADGSFVGFGLGWLDPRSGSVLFEPVGTAPSHASRGVARALCAEMLRVAHDLGATQAVVGPRGDDAYPVPRRLYEGLGMRAVGQVVSFSNSGPESPSVS
ncbi:GNAT family N-acetyltransferase [Actinoplanes sp. NPDC024001]|uniref:GNAT family N-acetyltransferase n=1 Tax=Actinoplanes sp. NPDC024001 TaxID=3154598 RepID=UPI0033C9DFEF